MFKNFSIKAKMLTILGIMFALFIGGAIGLLNTAHYLEIAGIDKTAAVLLAGQKDKIKVATHAMAESIKGVMDGITDPAKQIAVIRNAVDGVRYEKDQSGYFFVYRGTVCIALPTNPKLQGKDLANLHDKNGVYLVPELRDKAHAGGGFVHYIWPKPGQGDQPKLSYAEMIPGTDFWIGTGVYIDNLDQQKVDFAAQLNHLTDTKIWLMLGLAAVLFFLLIVPLSFLIIKSITGPMLRINNSLREGSQQVAEASGQVSTSSQALAEGASAQAASIEETSSSLEEMSSMIRQNADNAAETEKIVIGAKADIDVANQSMAELTTSMNEMARASAEIQKIIKTIDEIAFQTNLLALNAAVEAARAGEAGAGFAVVAEEVRNLAMRSAEAAKTTADLIESTVGKVTTGTRLVAETNEAFIKVTSGADKISKLVAEIAAASGEQAQGIAQINKAVGEMDKVVQSNAASAEESASASEEMNAQAIQMKALVEEMERVVFSRQRSFEPQEPRVSPSKPLPAAKARLLPPEKSGLPPKSGSIEKKEVRPEQVIPMDDDFEDF